MPQLLHRIIRLSHRRQERSWYLLRRLQKLFILAWLATICGVAGLSSIAVWGWIVHHQAEEAAPMEQGKNRSELERTPLLVEDDCSQCRHPGHCSGLCKDPICRCEAGPKALEVGAWIDNIASFSLEEGNWSVGLWLWAKRAKELKNSLNPAEALSFPRGEKTKEVIQPDQEILINGDDQGKIYWTGEYILKESRWIFPWKFPFDKHQLRIPIEAVEDYDTLRILPSSGSGASKDLYIPGYTITKGWSEIRKVYYETDFGYPSARQAYARFEYVFDIERANRLGLFLKLHLGLLVAVFVAMLALFIKPVHLDPRFGLPAAAVFTAAANNYIVSSVLPKDGVICISDIINITGLMMVFLVVLQSAISLHFYEKHRNGPVFSKCFDWATAGALMASGAMIAAAIAGAFYEHGQ